MKFISGRIKGLFVVEIEPWEDDRGFLARTYCEKEFASRGLNTRWPQCNLTLTRKRGTVRGMHFQKEPQPEVKLVRCIAGSVFDVVVDIRRASPTFGQWEGVELSAANRRSLYIPAGFAHGLQCLCDNCEVFYLMGDSYVPELACGVRWNDPAIGIQWPIADASVSPRDTNLPRLSEMP